VPAHQESHHSHVRYRRGLSIGPTYLGSRDAIEWVSLILRPVPVIWLPVPVSWYWYLRSQGAVDNLVCRGVRGGPWACGLWWSDLPAPVTAHGACFAGGGDISRSITYIQDAVDSSLACRGLVWWSDLLAPVTAHGARLCFAGVV